MADCMITGGMRYLVRLSVLTAGGWRAWAAARGGF